MTPYHEIIALNHGMISDIRSAVAKEKGCPLPDGNYVNFGNTAEKFNLVLSPESSELPIGCQYAEHSVIDGSRRDTMELLMSRMASRILYECLKSGRGSGTYSIQHCSVELHGKAEGLVLHSWLRGGLV